MIRAMKKTDWPYVTSIYKQGIDGGISTFNTQLPSYSEWDKHHISECRFVYEKDNKVIGWIALSPTSTRYEYRGVAEVSIYVDNSCHKKGIGTKLLQTLLESSEKAGYWSLYSSIISINKASISLHKKCGFREIGYREKIAKDKFGVWQDTVLMEHRSKIIL